MPSTLAYDPKFSLNAICPYFTMFPLEYPIKVIKKHVKNVPVILDPFCGRGTTLYAARTLGLQAWGIDASPIAVAIAQAKLASCTYNEVMALARKYIKREVKNIPDSPFFRKAFNSMTLRDVCAIREGLLGIRIETHASAVLRAAMLGCLHGPVAKTVEGAAYFSNQMPRTFSTKPDYSVKYWKDKKLSAPNVNVLKVLERKLSRIPELFEDDKYDGQFIVQSDSTLRRAYKSISKNYSLVITSPPYYGMRTYIQDQWLRLWFLGGPDYVDYSADVEQIDHNTQEVFTKALASVWKNVKKTEADTLDLYIRFGSVPSAKSDPKEIMYNALEEAKGFKVISVRNASSAHAGKRQADQMALTSSATDEFDFHVIRV